MDAPPCQTFFDQSPVPFAVGRVIFGKPKTPCDFQIIGINAALAKLLQVQPNELAEVKISLGPDRSQDLADPWLEAVREIQSTQTSYERDIYIAKIERWMRVVVFGLQNLEFGMMLTDLSPDLKLKQAFDTLTVEKEELEKFFSANLDLLCIADLQGHFIKVNKSWETILGYTVEELENSIFLQYVHPDDIAATQAAMSKLGQNEEVLNFINRYRCRDGTYRYIEWRSHPYADLIYAAARDITTAVMDNQALKSSEEKYRLITENTSDVIWVMNMKTMNYVYISPSIKQLRGISVEEAMAENFAESMTPESAQALIENENNEKTLEKFLEDPEHPQLYIHEIQQKCKNGDVIWVETSTKYRLNDQNEIECVGTSRNIEERKRAEQEILFLSYRDQMTGLYNRRFFEEEIKRLDTPRNLPIAIIVGDLNKLKFINDTYGHDDGDEYIIKTAQAIRASCRADDIASRWGGDEFVVLLPKTDQAAVAKIVSRIEANCQTMQVQGIAVSLALGVCLKTSVEQSIVEVIRCADDNMYKNKAIQRASPLKTL